MVVQKDDRYCPPGDICIRPLLYRTFALFWEHKGILLTTQIILLLIMFFGNYILQWVGGHMLIGPFLLGTYKINLSIARNEDPEIADFLSGFEHFLPAFVANILIHIGAFIGLGLLAVPAFLVLLTYAPTYFFIFEHNQGFWDAMESSRRMTWGNKKLWLTIGAFVVLINLAGFLCFVIGIVVSWTFTRLLITLVYEEERARIRREAEEREVTAPLAVT